LENPPSFLAITISEAEWREFSHVVARELAVQTGHDGLLRVADAMVNRHNATRFRREQIEASQEKDQIGCVNKWG